MSKSDRKTVIVGADTETDHDDTHAWVCQWAVVRMDANVKKERNDRSNLRSSYSEQHGYTLDSMTAVFDEWLNNESTDYVIYFHNLKYDVQFMRSYLHSLVERYYDPMDEKPDVCMIMRAGKPIIMRFHNLEFRDSANKMPAGTTVKQMGAIIGIPKLESPRGNFDAGWSKDLTDDDFQYVIHDALIVGTMMQKLHQLGRNHATSSGDAWASMKAIYNKNHNINGYGQWNKHYPTLTHETDAWLREGYFGGINISQHKGMNVATADRPITHEDVNSMYPTVMLYDILPYGMPKAVSVADANNYDCWVIRAPMRFKLKDGMIPVYKFKHRVDCILEGLSGTNEPVRDMIAPHILTMTNVDIVNYSRFYDIRIDFANAKVLAFDSEVGANADYINHWYKVKQESPKDSVERLSAKLMLNSAYGRFGMSDEQEDTFIEFDDELNDYDFKSSSSIADKINGYLPFAMFVTANARRRLLDNVIGCGCENVIHCDTDSVIHYGEPSPLGHTDALGDWGIEAMPVRIYEGGVKRYIEYMVDEPKTLKDISMACAGVPQKTKEDAPIGMWLELLDNPESIAETGLTLGNPHYRVKSQWIRELMIENGLNPDDADTMKLLPHKVKGGTVLKPTTFNLRDVLSIRLR